MRGWLYVCLGCICAFIVFAPIIEVTDVDTYNITHIDPKTGMPIYYADSHYETFGSCFENTVEINNIGFHGPDVSIQKPAGVFRIVLLGGSFIEARQVPVPETSALQLQNMLNAMPNRRYTYEVISLGVNMNSTFMTALYYDKYGSELKPDLAIDVESEYELLTNLQQPTRDTQGNIVLEPAPDQEMGLVAYLHALSRKSKLLINLYNRFIVFDSNLHAFLSTPLFFLPQPSAATPQDLNSPSLWQQKEIVISTLANRVEHDAPLVFAFWMTPPNASQTLENAYNAHMQPIAQKDGFTYVDLNPSFNAAEAAAGEPATLACDAHWSAAGNEYAAQSLYEFLTAHSSLIGY